MPNHKSAEKRDRQNNKREGHQYANRGALRTQVKKQRVAIASGDKTEAANLLSETVKVIDQSVRKGVLHRNTAARYKSRLTLSVNSLTSSK
jgi:small subunit ribosomal protein S20